MTKGIIFDMDGVLVDTENFYQERRMRYLSLMEYPIDPKMDLSFIGSNERTIWETLVPDDEILRQEMLQGYRAYRKIHPARYEDLADPSVGSLFRELKKRGIKIAIASSSEVKAIQKLIDVTDTSDFVDFIISGEECSAHKPDPEIYNRALAGLGLSNQEAFAVEDSPTGIAAARNAGLPVYALRPRYGEFLDQSKANKVIPQLFDVLDLL